jgi:receptor protein-tyrosine kinase
MTTVEQSVHLVERAAQRLRMREAADGLDPLAGAAPVSSKPVSGAEPEPVPAQAAAPRGEAADQARETITARQLERAGMVSQMTERNRVWEEFRIAQSQLSLNTPAAGFGTNTGANLCLVTSALPGEGKTFCAINLAASIARYSTSKVLLVDLDSKPKCLSSMLGVPNERFGVWDLAASPTSNPAKTVIATELSKVFFVPIGAHHEYESLPIGPAIRELGRHFSDYFIILDASPCLCSSTPSTLAGLVGQIVFVVEAERTQRTEIEAALALIETCPNVALMLNKIQSSASYTFGAYHNGSHYATARKS